jgi:hypothetical protein
MTGKTTMFATVPSARTTAQRQTTHNKQANNQPKFAIPTHNMHIVIMLVRATPEHIKTSSHPLSSPIFTIPQT